MRNFRMAKNEESGDNWLICWTGQGAQGNHFNVTTNQVHASQLYDYTKGAEGDAELIAKLLDWYYMNPEYADGLLNALVEAE